MNASIGAISLVVWVLMEEFVCVCADDIPLERLPHVMIPVGQFWDELENFWSDLVNELPDIPLGGNSYFGDHLKPSLGNTAYPTLLICMISQDIESFHV